MRDSHAPRVSAGAYGSWLGSWLPSQCTHGVVSSAWTFLYALGVLVWANNGPGWRRRARKVCEGVCARAFAVCAYHDSADETLGLSFQVLCECFGMLG